MNKLMMGLASVGLAGCVSVQQPIGEHSTDSLVCVNARENQMILNKGYRLVFFAKDYSSNVQVWLQPNSGRVMVLKSKVMSSKVCQVFTGLPAAVYVPYDKSVEEASSLIK